MVGSWKSCPPWCCWIRLRFDTTTPLSRLIDGSQLARHHVSPESLKHSTSSGARDSPNMNWEGVKRRIATRVIPTLSLSKKSSKVGLGTSYKGSPAETSNKSKARYITSTECAAISSAKSAASESYASALHTSLLVIFFKVFVV